MTPLGIAVSVATLLLLLVVAHAGPHLTLNKVIAVDHHRLPSGATNYLFRTPQIMYEQVFQYAELISLAQQRIIEDALPPLQFPVYLVVVNVLNTCLADDRHDIEREAAFFAANGTLGEQVNWPLQGTHLNPRKLLPNTVQNVIQFYNDQEDQLSVRVPSLKSFLGKQWTNHTNTSTIIVCHCKDGLDRTGEMMASYVMHYKNFTFPQAVEWDNSIAVGKAMHQRDQNEAAWYCFFLESIGFRGLDCRGEIPLPPTEAPS